MLDIDCVKSNFAQAIVKRCSESGCTLGLGGLGKYLVLKGEEIYRDRKMCDCIIFVVNISIIGIAELKSKTVHSSDVIEKLTNSSEVALGIIEKCADSYTDFRFYHIVLHKGLRTIELKNMKKGITIRGKKYSIIARQCGISFSKIVSGFKK